MITKATVTISISEQKVRLAIPVQGMGGELHLTLTEKGLAKLLSDLCEAQAALGWGWENKS